MRAGIISLWFLNFVRPPKKRTLNFFSVVSQNWAHNARSTPRAPWPCSTWLPPSSRAPVCLDGPPRRMRPGCKGVEREREPVVAKVGNRNFFSEMKKKGAAEGAFEGAPSWLSLQISCHGAVSRLHALLSRSRGVLCLFCLQRQCALLSLLPIFGNFCAAVCGARASWRMPCRACEAVQPAVRLAPRHQSLQG